MFVIRAWCTSSRSLRKRRGEAMLSPVGATKRGSAEMVAPAAAAPECSEGVNDAGALGGAAFTSCAEPCRGASGAPVRRGHDRRSWPEGLAPAGHPRAAGAISDGRVAPRHLDLAPSTLVSGGRFTVVSLHECCRRHFHCRSCRRSRARGVAVHSGGAGGLS